MNKHRYLFIGYNYYPEFTGIAKYTSELCNYLANEKKYDVHVITGNPYYPMWKLYENYENKFQSEVINGVHVQRLPIYIPEKPTGMRRMIQDFLFFFLGMLAITKKLISEKKYDYVFIVAPSFLLGFIGCYYKLFHKSTKIIYHVQDLQIDAAMALGLIKNQSLLKFLFSLERKILNSVDVISTISIGMKIKIASKIKEQKECLLFPNWIDNDIIFPSKDFKTPNAIIESFQDKKVIFYSGSIGEKQGLEIVIEVAERMKEFTDILFVISGEGPYKVSLEQMCKERKLENVILLNLIPLKEFNQLLNRANIHLIVQKNIDGDLFFPSKLNNILAVGGCFITTLNENGWIYHFINKHVLGKIIPPSSPDEMYNAILQLLANKEEQEKYTNNALRYAKNFLFKENVIENFLFNL